MKRLFVYTVFILSFLNIYSQDHSSNVERVKGVSNTYIIDHLKNGEIGIHNEKNPFEGMKPKKEWEYFIRITGTKGDEDDIINKYFGPYLQNVEIDKDNIDVNTLGMKHYFDLDGNVRYIEFIYSSKLSIPITAFETLEAKLKEEFRLLLKYKPENVKGIPYITVYIDFPLSVIKEAAAQK